jgi:hypothetical protein
MIAPEDRDDGSDSPYFPRIVLCIPGPWQNREELAARLTERSFILEEEVLRTSDGAESFTAEFRGPEPRMKSAFQASACRIRPSLRPIDYREIEGHRGVIYVLSNHYGRATAARAAARMVEVGRAVVEAGGCAVKCESSGIAHSADRWRELAERLRAGGGPDATRTASVEERAGAWNPLFDAFVRLPILGESEDLYSCGMHLLGCPDGIVELRDFQGENIRAGHQVLEGFLRSLRIDTAPGSVALNHVFKGAGTEDRFMSALELCTGVLPDDYFWNRWGCFRLRRQ